MRSKIRVLENRLNQTNIQPESETSSDNSSDSSSEEESPNHNKRRVIEIQDPNWEDKRRAEINKVKSLAKRRKQY